jgi:photosystem II stability/assembly factor-like uncharacterized protein
MRHLVSIVLVVGITLAASESEAQWEQIQSVPAFHIKDISISGDAIYLGLLNDGIYKSADSASTWEEANNGLNSTQARSVYQLLMLEGNIWAATVDGIYKSTDDGANWVKKSNGITIGPGALYEFTASIFEYNDVLFTGAANGIYKSTNNGEDWQITNVSGQGIFPGFFANHDGTLFLARENINLPYGYFSTDGGSTWEDLTSISVPTITFFSEPPLLWTGTIHGVWLSTDNGASWVERNNGLNLDPYSSSIIRVNGNLVTSLKFGGSGIFYSNDNGMNWIDFSEGLTFLTSIEELIVYGDKILAATSDGLWQRDTSDVVTGLTDDGSEIPSAFRISQNYPNPFNARTTINFNLNQLSNLSVEIYDLRGRRLETLFDGTLPAGEHNLAWNAEDYSSGVYFYKIQSDDFSEARKMVLLK